MTEKRHEFLKSIKNDKIDSERLKDLPDRGNAFFAARLESEELKRKGNETDKCKETSR